MEKKSTIVRVSEDEITLKLSKAINAKVLSLISMILDAIDRMTEDEPKIEPKIEPLQPFIPSAVMPHDPWNPRNGEPVIMMYGCGPTRFDPSWTWPPSTTISSVGEADEMTWIDGSSGSGAV